METPRGAEHAPHLGRRVRALAARPGRAPELRLDGQRLGDVGQRHGPRDRHAAVTLLAHRDLDLDPLVSHRRVLEADLRLRDTCVFDDVVCFDVTTSDVVADDVVGFPVAVGVRCVTTHAVRVLRRRVFGRLRFDFVGRVREFCF